MEDKACIKCNKNMSYIVYGYPTEDLYKLSEDNGWVLGGCMMGPVTHICKECQIIWSTDAGYEHGNNIR